MKSRTQLPAVGSLWTEKHTGHVAEVLSCRYSRARWRITLKWLPFSVGPVELPKDSLVSAFRPATAQDLERACPLTQCLVGAAERALLPPEELSLLHDVLSLVDRRVPVEALATWTKEERTAAKRWAVNARRRAFGNRVRVPPEPECLHGFQPPRTVLDLEQP